MSKLIGSVEIELADDMRFDEEILVELSGYFDISIEQKMEMCFYDGPVSMGVKCAVSRFAGDKPLPVLIIGQGAGFVLSEYCLDDILLPFIGKILYMTMEYEE